MRHRSLGLGTFLRFLPHRFRQLRDDRVQSVQQLQQIMFAGSPTALTGSLPVVPVPLPDTTSSSTVDLPER